MTKNHFYDNTRIKCFRACPRKYYFRHVLDWTREGFVPPLTFGGAWHAAMDVVWRECCRFSDNNSSIIARKAYEEGFLPKWLEEGGPHPDEMGSDELDALKARTPMVALEMLHNYVDERRGFLSEIELLAIEQPFAVPLDPEDETLFYVGRLDKVFKMKGGIYVGEHKTTSLYAVAGGFRSQFLDSFSPNSQIDGYLHALHMLYPKEAKAVWIDAALVHKNHHDVFKFLPIERQIDQLDSWLWETKDWIRQIKEQSLHLDQFNNRAEYNLTTKIVEQDLAYMSAFPKNTDSCQDFNRSCTYINLCKAWSNPIDHEVPEDFIVNKWSPFERLELERIGLEE